MTCCRLWRLEGTLMRFKVQPEDFIVEEHVHLPLARKGRYGLYRVYKRSLTTLQVQAQLAAALGVPRAAVLFPALKDRNSVSLQYAAVKGADLPSLEGQGYRAQLVGRSSRPLKRQDLQGNHFTVALRDLSLDETRGVRERLKQLEHFGLPNYFGRQRFGSYSPGQGFIGKKVLRRDVEGALRAYLSQPFKGDPLPVRAFKSLARKHWGDWKLLFEYAPRPSNLCSVLTFLKDHPTDFKKALNLVTPRLLSLWLSAYQSYLWNRIAGGYLESQLRGAGARWTSLRVVEDLPLYWRLPDTLLKSLRGVRIPLPHHRATFDDPQIAAQVEAVLAKEEIGLRDLKARVLKKAYLPKGERSLLCFPQEIALLDREDDECFPGRYKVKLAFFLPPGSYATLVLRALAGWREGKHLLSRGV